MERIPILRMGRFLLVTIQIEMDDQIAVALQEDLTRQIEKTGARGRADRYFGGGNGGFIYWQNDR